jgi:hypothetical protein
MKFSRAIMAVLTTVTLPKMTSAMGGDGGDGGGGGSFITTCATQQNCVEFEITKVSSPECTGECQFKVCMTLDLGGDCIKDSPVSHTCVKPDDECLDGGGFIGADEEGDIGDGFEQCQIIPAGGFAEFLLKDGNAANIDGFCGELGPTTVGGEGGVTCATAEAGTTCTGNVNKECVWRVPVPSDCDNGGGGGGDPHIGKCAIG